MKETTIIATVEITRIYKDAPECFELNKKGYAKYLEDEIRKALAPDDALTVNVQVFELDK